MSEDTPVAVGIDAAVTANHHIVVRRPQPGRTGQVVDDFIIAPTLGGLGQLTRRLARHHASLAAAEPTSMTWLSLAIALRQADVQLALVGARHVARLRGAVSGKNKSDVIDAQLLAGAGEVFDLTATTLPSPAELALQRACRWRGKLLVEANRCWRRLVALGRWAFPDVWNALGGSRPAIVAVLGRWPHLGSLARARLSSIAEEITRTSRGIADATGRARAVREAAAGWASFWDGHLDLDALAWELLEMLDQLADLQDRVDRASRQATACWEALWGDDEVLLSVPGMGPHVAPVVRAWMGDGRRFPGAKQAQAFVGLAPSNWSSGSVVQPSRAITKEGPTQLRLAFYQAANAARTVDPELACFYRRLMSERGHCHTQATVAVARKLVARTWRTMTRNTPYRFRDLDGNPITRRQAKELARTLTVDQQVRRRARAHTAATHRGRLTR